MTAINNSNYYKTKGLDFSFLFARSENREEIIWYPAD